MRASRGLALIWVLVVACGGSADLVSITIFPDDVVVAIGQTQQFTATGWFADHTTRDVTAEVTWASSSEHATISNDPGTQGLATAQRTGFTGTTKISATVGGITVSAALTNRSTKLIKIEVTPADATAPVLTRRQFQATASYSDGTTYDLTRGVHWTSSDPSIVMFLFNPSGQADVLAPGKVTVTASAEAIAGSTELTATEAEITSLEIRSDSMSVPVGGYVQFFATALLADGTTRDVTQRATWESSDPSIAMLTSPSSDIIGTGVGVATITVRYGSATTSATLTVTPAELWEIFVTPSFATVVPGGTQQFTATGRMSDGRIVDLPDVTWESQSTAATISTAGVATGVHEGAGGILASVGSRSGSAQLDVTAPPARASTPRDPLVGGRPRI